MSDSNVKYIVFSIWHRVRTLFVLIIFFFFALSDSLTCTFSMYAFTECSTTTVQFPNIFFSLCIRMLECVSSCLCVSTTKLLIRMDECNNFWYSFGIVIALCHILCICRWLTSLHRKWIDGDNQITAHQQRRASNKPIKTKWYGKIYKNTHFLSDVYHSASRILIPRNNFIYSQKMKMVILCIPQKGNMFEQTKNTGWSYMLYIEFFFARFSYLNRFRMWIASIRYCTERV